MKDQINTIREALLDARSLLHDGRRQDKALTALAQIEAAVGSQEPMFWVRLRSDGMYEGPIHNAQIERVRAQSGAWSPLFLGAAPVAQQYEAGDMASAAAQGFRDGVASVTQQEPVAFIRADRDGEELVWCKDEELDGVLYVYEPLYTAAPVAQQPLITVEDSLRFRLDCTKKQLEAAEQECAELRAKLKAQQPQADLLAAAKEFCRKVDAGEARSTTSYAAFKLAIERIEKQPQAEAVPPENCRQRLAHEGKAYPRSSCAACGKFSPKQKECDAAIAAQGAKT